MKVFQNSLCSLCETVYIALYITIVHNFYPLFIKYIKKITRHHDE